MPYGKSLFNSFCLFLFVYIVLYALSNLIPESMQKYGFFNNQLNLVPIVQAKASAVAVHMNETNLGLNFIGNFHKLSPAESQMFQSSGLVHLLAISGAQILPVVSLFCFLISFVVYKSFKRKIKSHKIMTISSSIRIFCSFVISLFIGILFGGTGALLRVCFLNFFRKINILHSIHLLMFKKTAEFSEPLLDKFFILFLVSFLFGSVFVNYSFILSAIGASCAEICAFCSLFFTNSKSLSIFRWRFYTEVLVTILTCIFVGVILSPLTYNSILNSCLANVFAIPIITFLVTPLALLVLIVPANNTIFELLLNGLDYSLMLFKYIAMTFSNESIGDKFSGANLKLFSPNGLLYLNVVMIVLWVIVDLIRGRKVSAMRLEFNKIID